MSRFYNEIDALTVRSVLLADGWHDVLDASFTVRGYEIAVRNVEDVNGPPYRIHTAGDGDVTPVAYWFKTFEDEAEENNNFDTCWMSGPFNAILAIKHSTKLSIAARGDDITRARADVLDPPARQED